MSFTSALDIIYSKVTLGKTLQPLRFILLAISVSSCIGTKYLEKNQSIIYRSAEITGVKNDLKTELNELVVQKPNKRLLGFLPFTHLVHAHKIGENRFDPEKYDQKIKRTEQKYDRKLQKTQRENKVSRLVNRKNEIIDDLRTTKQQGNWWMRIGEPLAIYDRQQVPNTYSQIKNYLIANGYFDALVEHQLVTHGDKKVSLKYDVSPGNEYVIDSISFDIPDTTLYSIISKGTISSDVKKGQVYSQKALENERNEIYQILSNQGYFNFSRQFVSFEVDTFSIKGNRILLTKKIANPSEGNHQAFTIDSLVFFSTNQNTAQRSTSSFGGITFNFGKNLYRPDILSNRIFISKDSLYSRANTIQTQQQLSFLDAFRFVNINYDSIDNKRLIANIFTSPLNRYQSSWEVGAISSSQQIPGPFVNLGIKKRNAFNGLETLDLSGNFSLQGISNVETESQWYTLLQFGVTSGITFPRFLFPVSSTMKRRISSFNPQTRLQIGFNYENRRSEYERLRTELRFSYLWRYSDKIQYNFTPFTFSLIDANTDGDFNSFLQNQLDNGNGALVASFNSSVISSSSFESLINLKQPTQGGDRSFLRLFMEVGGNFVNLLGSDFVLWERQARESSFSFFRWAKFNADYRRVHNINEKTNLAYRFNFGISYPYGDDPSLPYEKRFFIGGSNSVRAWQVRRLGPGSYSERDSTFSNQSIDLINYQLEQGGDMILEASLEYRRKLVGFVDYALFVDAGNIWMVNSSFNPDAQQIDEGFFKFDSFINEIALGAGVGVRLDFSFFVFRFDAAVQVHDPAQEMGNRWVFDDLPLGRLRRMSDFDREVLQNKTNLTLGIGLPF